MILDQEITKKRILKLKTGHFKFEKITKSHFWDISEWGVMQNAEWISSKYGPDMPKSLCLFVGSVDVRDRIPQNELCWFWHKINIFSKINNVRNIGTMHELTLFYQKYRLFHFWHLDSVTNKHSATFWVVSNTAFAKIKTSL